MPKPIVMLGGLAALIAAGPAGAQATDPTAPAHAAAIDADDGDDFGLSFSTGADYSTGDYGAASKTKILVVPFSLRASVGQSRFTATLPYLRIDSPGGVILGPDGNPLPGVPTTSGVRKGLGDLSLGYTYSIPPANLGGLELDLGARVKLPTSADRRQLGTGKTDVTVSADLSYPMGLFSPFVTAGYRFLGDPAGVELDNGFAGSIGTTAQLGTTIAILSYDYTEASSALAEDSHELFGAVSTPVAERLDFTLYGIAGLSEGSPDVGVGALLTFKLR
jgi:hypothetical protein